MKGYSWSREDYLDLLIKKYTMKDNFAWDYGDEYAFGEEVDFEIKEITHNIRPHSNQSANTETASACTIV